MHAAALLSLDGIGLLLLAALAIYLGACLAHDHRADTLADREAAFLAKFTGSREHAVGEAPHLVGNSSHPPTMQRSSGGATRHGDAPDRSPPSRYVDGPAWDCETFDDLPPDDRSLRGRA